jgi:riboflavin kinase/FMN adenylyltransferase
MASHLLHWDSAVAEECRKGAVTIGNFDGVHRGHQELLAELKRQAAAVAGPAVAVTFDPHPLKLLRPEQFQPLLTTVSERADLVHAYGADHVVILSATLPLLQLSPRQFFDQVLLQRLNAQALVEGPNFGFGRNREGTIETLQTLCDDSGRQLAVVPPFYWEGKIVSSSRVRQDIEAGTVGHAAQLLGHPFRLTGTVGPGQRRGQTLGFPTANLEGISTLVPGNGVYAVRVFLNEQVWAGAANIGPNPTFGEHARKIEVHLLDFEGDLYGKVLAVDFVERLRETRPFANADELARQLRMDVEQARRLVPLGRQ